MQFHIFIVGAALVLTVGSTALAAETVSNDTLELIALETVQLEPVLTVVEVSVELAPPAKATEFGAPMTSDDLENYRGGFETVNNDMQLSGSVANNSAVQVMTGSNSIAEGSFANASGLPMVIQNSGANVLIQNATIINVQYQ